MPRHYPLLQEEELARRIARLPALPPLVTDLIASFQQEDLDVSTLARRIAADQGLAVRTLRIANSPFYGLAGRVLSIDDAIMILGFRTVRSLVLGAAMVGAFQQQPCQGFNSLRFWRHSVAVGICARTLAPTLRENPETAFTGGLLHDIGQLTLATCCPEEYRHLLDWHQEHGGLRLEAEQKVLGVDHTRAGELLARQWHLPDILVRQIACHHSPRADQGADLIHLADILAHALELGCDPGALVPPLDPLAWQRLGLDEPRLLPLLARIEADFEETCHALLA